MIKEYKRIGQKSAGIFIACTVVMVATFPSLQGNVWETGNWLGQSAVMIGGLTYFFSFWYFAKAKGYSGFLGIFLTLFSILGVIILICLRDKKKELESFSVP